MRACACVRPHVIRIVKFLRSNYDPVKYNGTEGGERGEGGETAVESFSFSDLPRLDYGSEDERERETEGRGVGGATDEHSRDQIAIALRDLKSASRCVSSHMT